MTQQTLEEKMPNNWKEEAVHYAEMNEVQINYTAMLLEKLIEEIPRSAIIKHHKGEAVVIGAEFKKQLRAKWLGKESDA